MKSLIISSLELVISRLATMMIALPVSGCGQRRKRRTGAILVLISPAVGAVVGMIDRRHGRKRKKRTPRFVTVHRNDPPTFPEIVYGSLLDGIVIRNIIDSIVSSHLSSLLPEKLNLRWKICVQFVLTSVRNSNQPSRSPGCAVAAVYFGLMWNNVDNQ
ncbi:hypothetical protein T06_8651 [Trichinella sp. T6]|nr:hypothetical protein T06_8651 [Trichinella sp. T6]